MKSNHITDELLVKYLLDEATDAERLDVQHWLNENGENRDHFNALKLIWNQSKNVANESEVNVDDAWDRFLIRTKKPDETTLLQSSRRTFKWLKIAAVMLLVISSGWLVYVMNQPVAAPAVATNTVLKDPVVTEQRQINIAKADTPETRKTIGNMPPEETIKKTENEATTVHTSKGFAAANRKKVSKMKATQTIEGKAREYVCNSTACPIEICIVQAIKCQHAKPSIISTCSTIAPDESGQLRYKDLNIMDKNCASTVQQITIKRISTGETIVLTADSKPATAQDVFNYITGQKKGDIIAGIFHTDCNNRSNEDGIILDNKFGDLRLQ